MKARAVIFILKVGLVLGWFCGAFLCAGTDVLG